jgi:2-oxoglutarate ferredoxin oxidoreductase subunit alpha
MREPVELPDFETIEKFERRVEEPPEDYKPYSNQNGDIPPLASFGIGYRYHVTGLYHDERGYPTQRLDEIDAWLARINEKITNNLDDITLTEEDYQPGSKVGIISYGATARSARHAIREARRQGLALDSLTLFTLWPFAETEVEDLGKRVDHLIIPEMNQGHIASEVERLIGRQRVRRVTQTNGESVTPQMILEALEE